MERRDPSSAYLAAVGMTVAFGLSFVAAKYALRGFEPQLIAFLRFALAGGLLWVVWRLRPGRERASRAELKRLALLGLVTPALYFTLEIQGIARTSASEAAIIIAAIPIFVSALSALVLGERTARLQWAGIALSFAGVVGLMQFGAGAGGGRLAGNLLVLAASFAAAVYSLMARRLLLTRSALFVTTFQNLFGALFLLPLALLEMAVAGVRTPTSTAVGAVLYLTLLCSMAAYLLLNYAFRFLEASRVAVFINLTPVVAVIGAYLLLGERLTAAQVAAAVVVIVGVWVTNSGRPAKAKPEAPAEALRSPSAG
ncbi:MAG TPA: DMT family transporter [Thermoleophilia bacterium]|nr:DMT family transporter [Thermoleophilia bacterium]